MPFTCQHCGGKFCEEHRLPPNHDCVNIGSWNAKPRPAIGLNYGKGGVTVTGGGYLPDQRRNTKKDVSLKLPWLKILAGILVLILLGLAWLALSGYRIA